MAKKTSGSELVTKNYLDEALGVRFKDFNKQVDAKFGEVRTEANTRFGEFEERLTRKMEEAITGAMDKLYTRIDPLLSELENNRIDREITTQKLEEFGERITKLEHS